jgi:hypothetical protein
MITTTGAISFEGNCITTYGGNVKIIYTISS